MNQTPTPTIPPGYYAKADGTLVPESLVTPIDRTRDELVRELAARAQAIAQAQAAFRAHALAEIAAFVQLSAEHYGVKVGGSKGNVTLASFDGRWRIQRAQQETIAFDERLQAAKELIDDCIKRWTQGGRDEVRALINDAFQVDKAGLINTNRVLGLRRLNISDPEWQAAMQAISDSVTAVSSKTYVRVYERVSDSDRYQLIGDKT